MKKWLSYFSYNERSRSGWTLSIPLANSDAPVRSTMKTVTYVPGTFVTLVPGPHTFDKGGCRGIFFVSVACGEVSRTMCFVAN
jgi:hypothetical protein